MLKLKPEVRFHDAQQALAIIAIAVENAFRSLGHDAIVTAAADGAHKPDSFHYRGLALDFRTKHVTIPSTKAEIVARVRDALPQCDVLFENEGTPNEHLHVEYDPK